jgi:hypothetical protein
VKNSFGQGLTQRGALPHPWGKIFNRTPPVLHRIDSLETTRLAASAMGLVASVITTTGTTTTTMPLRAGTG